jgi:drug/metabolite transporter (DMT)-like permease
VVFAFCFGVVIFGEIPDTLSFIGIGIIVAAGIYILHREAIRRRA